MGYEVQRGHVGSRSEGSRSRLLRGAAVALIVALLAASSQAIAQEGQADPEADVDALIAESELLPEPRKQPPVLAGEVHLDAVAPLARRPLCPEGSACILGGGAGVGGRLERRLALGLALGLGYDVWFLDGNGVHELTIIQMLNFGVRYFFMRKAQVHPYVGLGFGGLVLGESFGLSAVGAALEGFLGVEVELSTKASVNVAAGGRAFTTTEFRTSRDGVRRGEEFGANVALVVRVGLVIHPSP